MIQRWGQRQVNTPILAQSLEDEVEELMHEMIYSSNKKYTEEDLPSNTEDLLETMNAWRNYWVDQYDKCWELTEKGDEMMSAMENKYC